MDTGAILIGIIILAGTVPILAAPFGWGKPAHPIASDGQADPVEQRQDTLRALRDLDFDFRTGKVNEEDYPSLRAGLLAEAAKFVRQEQTEDDAIEARIAARRARKARLNSLNRPIPNSTSFCPVCGQKLYPTDRFCTSCGSVINIQS